MRMVSLLKSVLFLVVAWLSAQDALACAKAGVCDLSTVPLAPDQNRMLDGEWQFYWKQLVTPNDIAAGRGQLSGYLSPDVLWDQARLPGLTLHNKAYATYHVQFQVPPGQPYTLRFPELPSAVRIWVNEQEVASFGTISTDGFEEKARQRLFYYNFEPRPGLNSITIQISNFSFLYHGGRGGVQIGPTLGLTDAYAKELIRDTLVFGAILIMAFYHFYLWAIRRNNLAPLYFGIFCFSVGIRSLAAGNAELLTFHFPETPLEMQLKLEYGGIALGAIGFLLLVRELYPQECVQRLVWLFTGLLLAWFVLILVTGATVYPRLLFPYQMIILAIGISQMLAIGIAIRRRREGALIFLMGFLIFFATAILDILMAIGITKTPPLSHVGNFFLVFSQAVLLSKRFNKAFDQAEQAEKQVRGLNEVLEQRVKERTDQINTILANVSSGFLLIDRAGRLLPGFTDSCHRLLGLRLEAGQLLPEILVVDEETRRCFIQAVVQVFEDLMPADVSLSQIPARVRLNGRTLGVSGAELRDPNSQKIKAILFTINDVTSLQEAEKRVQYNEMLLNIIQEREAFRFFLHDYRLGMEKALNALQSQNQQAVRNYLHTLKGNLGAFGIYPLVEKVHEIEWRDRVEEADLRAVAAMMDQLLTEHAKTLRIEGTGSDSFEISREDYDDLQTYIRMTLKEPERSKILRLFKKTCQKAVGSYIGPIQNTAVNLAKKLGKELRCEIVGDYLRVDDRYVDVLRNLIHLVRNSVDHGIELPEDRGHKNPEGFLRLTFSIDQKHFHIICEDDGRGLNYERIRQKASMLGLASDDKASRMTEAELKHLIFMPSFSTAEEVTDISGRGVGMSAIADAVQMLQGTIEVESQTGIGLRIAITLPLLEDEPVTPMNRIA